MTDYNDESDFFGLVQVGIFRDNEIKLEDLVRLIKILVRRVTGMDKTRLIAEMNFKGDLLYDKIMADENFEDIFVYTKHTEAAKRMNPGIKYNGDNKMKYCELLRGLTRNDRILINDKKWTIPELFTFGLNGRGTYSSQSGHDDVAMTLVNLPCIFDNGEFKQIVGDMYDEMENEVYKDMITKKIEGPGLTSEEDPFGQRRSNFSKEGKGYSDFSKLL